MFTRPVEASDIYQILNQNQLWYDIEGREHRIDDMPLEYKRNVVRFLERRVDRVVQAYELGEIQALFTTHWPSEGSAAADALDGALDREMRQRTVSPMIWLHHTPLMRRLRYDVRNHDVEDIGFD